MIGSNPPKKVLAARADKLGISDVEKLTGNPVLKCARGGLSVDTASGILYFHPGDMIIKHSDGTFSAMSYLMFESRYQRVKEEE